MAITKNWAVVVHTAQEAYRLRSTVPPEERADYDAILIEALHTALTVTVGILEAYHRNPAGAVLAQQLGTMRGN